MAPIVAARHFAVISIALMVAACAWSDQADPTVSREAQAACSQSGRPYTGDQPPPGYPDAMRGTGEHSNEWYVPSALSKDRWGILCISK
jgi:hypothetical protein